MEGRRRVRVLLVVVLFAQHHGSSCYDVGLGEVGPARRAELFALTPGGTSVLLCEDLGASIPRLWYFYGHCFHIWAYVLARSCTPYRYGRRSRKVANPMRTRWTFGPGCGWDYFCYVDPFLPPHETIGKLKKALNKVMRYTILRSSKAVSPSAIAGNGDAK